jgi:hypothetical protein
MRAGYYFYDGLSLTPAAAAAHHFARRQFEFAESLITATAITVNQENNISSLPYRYGSNHSVCFNKKERLLGRRNETIRSQERERRDIV